MKEGAFRIPTIRVQLQLRLIAAQQGLVLGSSGGHNVLGKRDDQNACLTRLTTSSSYYIIKSGCNVL